MGMNLRLRRFIDYAIKDFRCAGLTERNTLRLRNAKKWYIMRRMGGGIDW